MRRLRLVLLLIPQALTAQQVELRVLEEATRAPVAGAIVRLLDQAGVAAQGLTSESGRLVLRGRGAGAYRLRVDRIGWAGLLTDAFALADGQVLQRELTMASRRVELPPLEVRGKSRCEKEGQGGPLAAALWDEVGKALIANVMTIRQGGISLHVRSFVRELDLKHRAERQWNTAAALTKGPPFASLRPSLLADVGFVQQESRDSTTFAAPDAALLLSEEFVGTHCFKAVPGPEGLVGLAFEPTTGRKVADVRGTLWVDRLSSELRYLEYGYTGLGGTLARIDLGGRVEFRRLPSGAWIVGYWHIRTPRVGVVEIRTRGGIPGQFGRLVGFLDLGGRADIAQEGLTNIDRAVITGTVFDSLAQGGMAGAVVRISGFPDSAVTDSSGRYQLLSPGSGDQRIVVSHPRESLLARGAERNLLLSIGDTVTADFSVAPLASFVKALCGTPPRGRSGIIGMAWDADGKPALGLQALVRWTNSSGGARSEARDISKAGFFAFCDLPPDRTLPVYLMRGTLVAGTASQLVTVRLEWGEFRWVELRATR